MRRGVMAAAMATLILAGTTGCALRPATGNGSGGTAPSRVIDAEEIERSSVKTAWDALYLLSGFLRMEEDKDQQPARVSARGRSSINLSNEPRVVLDGVRLVEYEVLHSMSATLVERIELLTGPDATTRYGTNAGHGIIVITTKTAQTARK